MKKAIEKMLEELERRRVGALEMLDYELGKKRYAQAHGWECHACGIASAMIGLREMGDSDEAEREPKYVLVVHGESGEPAGVTIHRTKEDRTRATLSAIFGESDPVNGSHEEEMRKSLEILERDGLLDFEGDPSIEWHTAHEANSSIERT